MNKLKEVERLYRISLVLGIIMVIGIGVSICAAILISDKLMLIGITLMVIAVLGVNYVINKQGKL